MRCDKCRNESVFFQSYSGRHLCGRHLLLDVETRAKHSVRSHRWICSNDHIAVPVYGDRSSAVLLSFLKKLTADRRDIRLSAVLPCKGDAMMVDRSAARQVAESLRIPWIEMPPMEYETNDQGRVTKIALGITIDGVAQSVLGEFLFGNVNRLVQPGSPGKNPLPVICPFITVPSEELDLSWEFWGTAISLPRGSPAQANPGMETETLLKDYSRRHPATKYALLHLAEQLSSGNAAGTAVACAIGREREESPHTPQESRPHS